MALTKVTGQVIKNTTDVTVGVLTVTNTLAVGGTVSIGGTLTYEDVTNVDAVGLITARNGIIVGSGITLSKDGDGFFTGVITATSYSGIDLSAVTGATDDFSIADKIVHTGDTNTAIRFPAADTITAETGGSSRFKIDSSGNVTIGNDGDSGSNPSSGYDELCIEGGNEAIGMCFLSPAANDVEQTIAFGDSNNNQSGKIQYEHANDAMHFDTAGSERVRILSDGKVGVNKTAPNFHLDVAGNIGLTEGQVITWHNGSGTKAGDMYIDSSDNFILRNTSSVTERIRIDSGGHMGLGVTPNANWPTNNDYKALQLGTGACVFGRGSGDDDRAGFAANYYATGSGNAYLANGHANLIYLNDGNIDFYTAAQNSSGAGAALTLSQILRMNTSGNLKVGNNSDRDLGGLSNQRLHIEGTDGAGSAIGLVNNQNSTGQAAVYFSKSRGTSVGSNTILQDGDPMGSLVFCGSDGNDMISIGAQITAEVDGTPGSNDMPGRIVFKTTPNDSALPTERFRIDSNGNIAYKNQNVFQRKAGSSISLSSNVTHDIKICGDMGNNDIIRVCWAINWNAGDGGAWGEAVIWKQYEGTVRVRFITDVKASPISSVSFPDSGDSVWLRMATNAGINGFYMIDVQTHGCTPHPF